MKLPRSIALLLLLSAPLAADSSSEAIVPMAGEPVSGFPGWEERVLLQLTNRARVEPMAELEHGDVDRAIRPQAKREEVGRRRLWSAAGEAGADRDPS